MALNIYIKRLLPENIAMSLNHLRIEQNPSYGTGIYNEFIELAANLKEITPFQLTSLISAHRRGKKRFCVQVPVEGPYRFGFPFERGTEAICLH